MSFNPTSLEVMLSVVASTVLAWRHIDSRFDLLQERIAEVNAKGDIQGERFRGEISLIHEKLNNLDRFANQLYRVLDETMMSTNRGEPINPAGD